LKQIKLTGNRRPTVRRSGGGHSLEILSRAPEIIDPPLNTCISYGRTRCFVYSEGVPRLHWGRNVVA